MSGLTGTWVARDGGGNGTLPKGARQAQGGLLAGNGASALDVRKGVLADASGPVVSGTAAMTYSVRSFRAVTMVTTANGPVVVANDAAVVVATTAAPGSNSRIDVIWCRQHLVAGDGGSDSDVILEIGVTQGAVAASPAVPAIPSGALSLAQVTVTAGTTATNTLTFTRSHNWTTANGGILPIYTSAERTALTPWQGMSIFYIPDLELQTWDGSAWKPSTGTDTGWVNLTFTSGTYGTPAAQLAPQCRRIGKRVYFRGSIERTSGTFANGNTPAIVPVGFRPPTDIQSAGIASNTLNNEFKLEIGSDGVILFVMNAGGIAPSYINLDQTSYLID